jgi:general secretion pathway protein H
MNSNAANAIHRRPGPASRRGFTLLELMVVVLIIGLGLSVISVAIGRDDVSVVRTETQNFIAKVDFVAEQALLNREILGLFVEPRTVMNSTNNQWCYRWQRFRDNSWQAANENLGEVCLPLDVQLDMIVEDEPWEYDADLESQPPVLVFYPSGEATLFEMALFPVATSSSAMNGDDIQRIEIDMMGEVRWLNRERELAEQRAGR